ncbi:hypothetical protein PPTG_21981 [Phytophthora nicotianae INRA-310]|uniref:Uncharacterized protein n=1 Tax=Phytophthora nicotianae (strain INRA-310) TaxID=761204 RepID=W2QRV4_PHYN3|nr:hypothetical protein PPTG_21981 [Phytophthora nicotianae INRA-310]ETN15686.1 hypothetical protein PPTG_21981 [Phytophthora nicotianae INRA-310]
MIDSIFVPVMPRYSDAPDRKAKSELLERLQDDAVQGTDLSFYALNEGELPKPGRLGACMTCDGVGSIAVQTGRDRQCALAFTIARSRPTKSVFFERSPGDCSDLADVRQVAIVLLTSMPIANHMSAVILDSLSIVSQGTPNLNFSTPQSCGCHQQIY